jgi:hypothetical protein
MIRVLPCLVLCACWSGSRSAGTPANAPETPHGRAPSLAIEDALPGRLVFDRSGVAWEVKCDGKRLTRRPWQGGPRVDVAACDAADSSYVEIGMPPQGPALAIEGDAVALFSERQHAIVVTRRGVETQRYPVSDYVGVVAVAIDGNALLAAVTRGAGPNDTVGGVSLGNSLAAIVRLENGSGTAHELVRYMSTGPSVTPRFMSASRDHMLLVATTGNTIVCDYQMKCGEPRMTSVGEIHTYAQLPDGGMVVLDWESSVSRFDAHGVPMWTTTQIWPMSLVGATASHVWYTTLPDDPRAPGLVVRALSLTDGREAGDTAILFPEREEYGRYLTLFGVAPTPEGTVIRGVFGGTLTAGRAVLETKTLGGLCWWENPHDGHEYEVEPEESCNDRHAKAVLTEKKPFVAVAAEALHAKKWVKRAATPSP